MVIGIKHMNQYRHAGHVDIIRDIADKAIKK